VGIGLGLAALAALLLTKQGKAGAVGAVKAVRRGGEVVTKLGTFVVKGLADAKTVGAEANLPVWLIITQAAHESGVGLSKLTELGNNLFGFTGESWAKQGKPVIRFPTREFINGAWVTVQRPFRRYANWTDSMRDYARLLTTQPRYAEVVRQARAGNIPGTFAALGRSGYATDPTYGDKLAGVYQSVATYLVA
jgi:flagellar protein FlgJ